MIAALALLAAAQPAAFDCRAELEHAAEELRGQSYEAVEGPYEVSAGDLRIHAVAMEGNGHRIVEYHCEDGHLVSRSWIETMVDAQDESWNRDSLERIAGELYKRQPE
jgi:hypothetical protein